MQRPSSLADTLPLEDEAGDVLAKARFGLGLDVAEVAVRTGAGPDRIEAWERLEEPVDLSLLDRLARALDLGPDALRELACPTMPLAAPTEPEDGWETLRFTLSAHPGGYASNTWIVRHRTRSEAWLVDPGFHPEIPARWLADQGIRLGGILVTHGHADHSGGARWLARHTGATAWLDPADLGLVPGGPLQGEPSFRTPEDLRHPDIRILRTPGHTPGGTTWAIGQRLFVGDTMFASSLGRTFGGPDDHPGHRASLARILSEAPETVLCPGHGPATTVGRERAFNPFAPEFPDRP